MKKIIPIDEDHFVYSGKGRWGKEQLYKEGEQAT